MNLPAPPPPEFGPSPIPLPTGFTVVINAVSDKQTRVFAGYIATIEYRADGLFWQEQTGPHLGENIRNAIILNMTRIASILQGTKSEDPEKTVTLVKS